LITAPRSTSTGRAAALVVVALAAAGWLVYTQWWGQGGGRQVAWRDLTSQLGPVEFTHKLTAVYHSRASFHRLLEATMPSRTPTVPAVEWARDEVIVIALGPRSSTGYSLRILRVLERRRGIYVTAREETPTLSDPVAARVTYPYRALAIHGSAKPVYVKLQGRP
jgi:hypothetical protein